MPRTNHVLDLNARKFFEQSDKTFGNRYMCGLIAVGQVAAAALFAVGQLATGLLAVGQVSVGLYALGQAAWGRYVWTPQRVDMEAVALFYTIYFKLAQLVGLQ